MASRPRISAQEKEWRAQEALSTLTRANQIQSDRSLMADVKKYAAKQVATLSKVAGTTKKPAAKAKAKRK